MVPMYRHMATSVVRSLEALRIHTEHRPEDIRVQVQVTGYFLNRQWRERRLHHAVSVPVSVPWTPKRMTEYARVAEGRLRAAHPSVKFIKITGRMIAYTEGTENGL